MSLLDDKLMVRGASSLSDIELLTLLLDDMSDSGDVAKRLYESCGTLARLAANDVSRLRMMEGVGLRRAQRLVLAAELGRRCSRELALKQDVINTSHDVALLFSDRVRMLDHEEFWVLYLNSQNYILEQQCVARGGVMSAAVDNRLIAKRALELLSTRIIVVHNHPSGGVDPSEDDLDMTGRLRSALALFDIDLLDHLILSADGQELSLLSAGML